MASCGLVASNIKLAKLDFGNARLCSLQKHNAKNVQMGHRSLQHRGAISLGSKKKLGISCCSHAETEVTTNEADGLKVTKSSGSTSQVTPNASTIESLLKDVCDTTSIAEFELKLGSFHLYVARNLTQQSKTSSLLARGVSSAPASPPAPAQAPDPTPAPVTISTTADGTGSNGAVSTSLAIQKPFTYSGSVKSFIARAADEGLVILPSPRVGFFRRSRTIKGKRAPPSCMEKQMVKEGQVLCYIEQLGGELPIESDVSGEVIKILREDGEPVGYGDALIVILP